MLIDALVIFVAIIAIFVLHILLGMRQLVRLGEMRRDYVREGAESPNSRKPGFRHISFFEP
jgi:hypothetical protein